MKTIAIMSIAGLAAAASAQSLSADFAADVSQAATGDTIHWTATVSFSGFSDPSAYFGGFVGDFLASDNTLGTADNFLSHMAGEGVPPTANGADVNLNIFNSALLGTDDQSNPYLIFEWDVTAGSGSGDLSYSDSGVWSMFADDGIFSLPIEMTANVTSDVVGINVPAPGALALLGLGGLTATRRRR